ncbi:MAG TPA: AmmeMemoRadiSam system protein A [Gammaproteobacteria bacterium]
MFSPKERALLLDLAESSIRHGITHRRPLPVELASYPEVLRQPGACFVTLKSHGALRGCIGTLEARHPLVEDVAGNAWAAAFSDPRFPPLTSCELHGLELHISVLTTPQPMCFNSESDLLAQLKPGVDGLIIEDEGCRGTFLPSVWESLPRPADFLCHLKMKAGLPSDHWTKTLQVSCYQTESFGKTLE